MRTSKNGKKKCLGMLFCGYNHMLCKMSSSWGMCTPKNKKKEMSGYVFDEYKLYVVQKQR